MSTLIICLPTAAHTAVLSYDYVVTPDGRTLADHASAPLALLPAVQRGDEVVAVVPVSLLSWHEVNLPKGIGSGSTRLRAILDNLLEDRLLDEPVQLHLALASGTSGTGPAWVAACDKNWLRGHLLALEAAGRPAGRIVPEFSPEDGPLQIHLIGEPEQAQLVATGKELSGVLRLPLGPVALALLPQSAAGEDVLTLAEPAVAALAEDLLQRKTSLLTAPQRWLDAARSPWDLAQFDLASSGRTRTVKRLSGVLRDILQAPAWRPARWGVAVLLLAHLVGLNAWAWKEQSAQQLRRAAIQGTLTQTFPGVRVVVDAPLQMERELAALRQATGAASGRDLDAILAALASVAPEGSTLTAIDYSAGEARLKGLPTDQQEVGGLYAQLAALGYSLRLDGEVSVIRQDGKKEGTP
ncbi:MAG: type II secretion system protein GspL [Pseudomonadota bacterium]